MKVSDIQAWVAKQNWKQYTKDLLLYFLNVEMIYQKKIKSSRPFVRQQAIYYRKYGIPMKVLAALLKVSTSSIFLGIRFLREHGFITTVKGIGNNKDQNNHPDKHTLDVKKLLDKIKSEKTEDNTHEN